MAYTTINKSTDYFNTKLYTGNASTNAITGVGFQPDWLWFKNRADTYNNHVFDVIRGVNQQLQVDSSGAESTYTTSMTSFDSDGFTLGNNNNINYNGNNHVAWCWKANGSGSSNTDGSVTSTVSANTTAGFSIVKWTSSGNTQVGHGLGVSPDFIIMKSISGDANWIVGSDALGWSNRIKLNDTAASGSSGAFQSTSPTSSIFYENYSSTSYDKIAYCFVRKNGFSKFGSYIGNGSTDGSFVYTGFKPAFVMLKYSSPGGGVGNWGIHDSVRDVDNPISKGLIANSSAAEDTSTFMDFLSNGFKLRSSSSNRNENSSTYIYMAFAASPLVGSNNVPCTAR